MNKQDLSESAICTKYSIPALEQEGWDRMLQMRGEFELASGQIHICST